LDSCLISVASSSAMPPRPPPLQHHPSPKQLTDGSRIPRPRPMHGNRMVTSPRPWLECCTTTTRVSSCSAGSNARDKVTVAVGLLSSEEEPAVATEKQSIRPPRHSDRGEWNGFSAAGIAVSAGRASAADGEETLPLLPAPAPARPVDTRFHRDGGRSLLCLSCSHIFFSLNHGGFFMPRE
jgi:hypothetical protein